MPKLLYQGHGSYRFTTDAGKTVYFDPYAGTGYDVPADLVLITHRHYDHTGVELLQPAEGCETVWPERALRERELELHGVRIRTVQAKNKNHDPAECCGYVLEIDGVKLYCSGDTSETEEMHTLLPQLQLDYAILCGDGVYNMDVDEASRCAALIGARHSIPIHLRPGELYGEAEAARFTAAGKLLVRPGEEIEL